MQYCLLTAADLRGMRACEDQIDLFACYYPDGVRCPDATEIARALDEGLDVDWLAHALAPASLWNGYVRQRAALWAKYVRQRDALWARYVRQGALWDEYERQRAALRAEYERQRAELLANLFAAVWPVEEA